jgi:hypothetical protein
MINTFKQAFDNLLNRNIPDYQIPNPVNTWTSITYTRPVMRYYASRPARRWK